MNILVTGGAGYIGSHVVKVLAQAGHELTIVDNLSNGFREAVVAGELVVCDLNDRIELSKLFAARKFQAVLHFAASANVGESVTDPDKYFVNNTRNSQSLIELCLEHGCKQFIFSSTAAVYGEGNGEGVREEDPKNPISPYGLSKLQTEQLLEATSNSHDFKYVVLRYFNVAGADPEGKIGESTSESIHLIKAISEVACGKREQLEIFGSDYSTDDGTCVRDYIHVVDLAHAHAKALDYLSTGNSSVTLNCGYGHGFSVRQVIEKARDITGKNFAITFGPRREGDAPVLISDVKRIKEVLNWNPQFDNIDIIIKSAYEWEQNRHY